VTETVVSAVALGTAIFWSIYVSVHALLAVTFFYDCENIEGQSITSQMLSFFYSCFVEKLPLNQMYRRLHY
jgi:hypothetical protein